ncbi:MAG: Phenylalanine--tRNA ligase alpha subunit [bacterium ADurb.Bin157]|jgi:phenylalanyl-tRNA synthetase alpha chain|nr:phenylalanine--tRNA ligase subunit alpha [Candidatus Riflebacteria bacterium]MDD3377023.1 phenylalanine--tRNA ligase subunit alpha [Candidatus Riflebacteria bacterium]NCB46575.1 phenylalanine--tRNA ligase subunit alpha [bacterium]OQB50653.1 MAG: Phenylalanine--tRNA ligase alpha subunit [bacterium ADurb.Bin157]
MSDSHEMLLNQFLEEKEKANSTDALETLRVKYLGKKGEVTELLKGLGKLPIDEKKIVGAAINELKAKIQKSIEEAMRFFALKEQNAKLNSEKVDITMPGTFVSPGSLHPVTLIANEVSEIFLSMGFFITDGPEIEEEYYNFEALNVPKHHPARDMQDTFYLESGQILRTQTSPMQIRTMEKMPPPLKMIALGKVYRVDSDITHSPMFHQIEGLVVGENVSMSDLKGTMIMFVKEMFGKRPYRFRTSFFPFTEPSAEMDIQCIFCEGKGCNVCKGSGWIEILGCGMVNPKVFEAVNYDTEKYSGFAFGMGIERIAMLRYGINDIRLLYNSDVRFLKQF